MVKLTLAEKRARNKLDRKIEEIVRKDLCGIPIDIMDISKVFMAGFAAAAAADAAKLGEVERDTMIRQSVIAKYKELAK